MYSLYSVTCYMFQCYIGHVYNFLLMAQPSNTVISGRQRGKVRNLRPSWAIQSGFKAILHNLIGLCLKVEMKEVCNTVLSCLCHMWDPLGIKLAHKNT